MMATGRAAKALKEAEAQEALDAEAAPRWGCPSYRATNFLIQAENAAKMPLPPVPEGWTRL